MDTAKIQFSAEELKLASDAALILTKNRIMRKVTQQFSSLSEAYRDVMTLADDAPVEIAQSEPRISKGEQYHELPWVMLDYPRIFSRDEIFAIRTMFWWGHDYSITLHLRGKYLLKYRRPILQALQEGRLDGFLLSNIKDEWMHHHDGDSHLRAENMDQQALQNLVFDKPFLKLRQGFPVTNWPETETNLRLAFFKLIQVFLGVSSQDGERVL